MGYTIKIGNATPYHDKDDGILSAGWRVESVRHDNAPAYGEPTDYTNSRWPSYSAWADTLNALGLYPMFMDRNEETALMAEHPGCAMLTAEHVGKIRDAVNAYRARVTALGFHAGFKDPHGDPHLARAEWLLYWVEWALANCETPAIENS